METFKKYLMATLGIICAVVVAIIVVIIVLAGLVAIADKVGY